RRRTAPPRPGGRRRRHAPSCSRLGKGRHHLRRGSRQYGQVQRGGRQNLPGDRRKTGGRSLWQALLFQQHRLLRRGRRCAEGVPNQHGQMAASPSSQSVHVFNYPGANPSISANGNAAGIVWALENNNGGILFAFDASNLANELYDSNQAAGGRDHFPNSLNNKFTSPMVANGRVYVQTPSSVAVF